MKPIGEQVMLVTGSTDGIGRLTALRLARMGAAVLLHGREAGKCRTVMRAIREDSGNPNLEWFAADLSSLPEVRSLAAAIGASYPRLDVLINNAGVFPSEPERHFSEQGYDLCLAVNYLAPFLLTALLLPYLRAAETARVINVCSAAQERIDFKDLMLAGHYTPMKAYARSKLALTMITFELSERLRGGNVSVNCVHPGTLLDTKMVRQSFSKPQGRAESGAEVEVYLATAPELEGISGAYFDRTKRSRAHSQAYDHEARRRLWQISQDLVGLADVRLP